MKKAGILAVLIASFSLAFSAPGASANRWEGIEPRGNAEIAPARFNDNNTIGEDMREGYQNMKNGMQRATNRVEYDTNRAVNRLENGTNRAMNRVDNGMNRTFDTQYDKSTTNGRYNTMNTTGNGYRANAAATTTNRGWSWGWLGLLGLLGLAGMRNRERDRA